MNKRHKLFWSVAAISFAGSLPPGILNTGVAGLVAGAGPLAAIAFGLGAILAEMTIVRLAHAGTARRAIAPKFPRWLAIGLSLALISWTLLHASKNPAPSQYAQYPFLAGLLLSTLNPLHLPFWLGWTVVLKGRNLLAGATIEYHLFALAIGAGTTLAFLAYGTAGHFILQWWQTGSSIK
ncbi:MAG TPA: hypothetical protein VGM89_05545 [Puia sp.]|jgi:threonine/homoserine/homoserine lactone efflux protein